MDEELAMNWLKGTLKGELAKRGSTYADLLRMLNAMGVHETEGGLRNKLSRGTFSALFFCQCLAAMGVTSLQIDLLEFVDSHTNSNHEKKYGVVVWENDHKGEKRRIVWLRWSFNHPSGGSIMLLPSDDFPMHSGDYGLCCGNCGSTLLSGWSIDVAQAAFRGTDKAARCAGCGAYNELPGSSQAVEMGPIRAE